MTEPSAAQPRQFEILVVESNPADTMLTVAAFKAAGLNSGLNCVKDGSDALKYVRREPPYVDAPIPDLIFLDLSNPSLTSLEVLKVIKKTRSLMHIPIVVAAGSTDPQFIRAVYRLNGNCFIRKPEELTQFIRFVEICYEFWGKVVTLAPAPPMHRPRLKVVPPRGGGALPGRAARATRQSGSLLPAGPAKPTVKSRPAAQPDPQLHAPKGSGTCRRRGEKSE
jgi:chemotaxis family two-component system response regulator Rcp1